jgi:hypothetical protein
MTCVFAIKLAWTLPYRKVVTERRSPIMQDLMLNIFCVMGILFVLALGESCWERRDAIRKFWR